MVRLNKCSNLVECVDFSDLSGATVGCLEVFPNKYHKPKMFVCPVPKISQVLYEMVPPSFTLR